MSALIHAVQRMAMRHWIGASLPDTFCLD